MFTCPQKTAISSPDFKLETGVRIAYVGLDVHKLSISLAALCEGKWVFERTFATADLTDLKKALKKLKQLFGQVLICYEASGCGFRLQRHITEWGYVCQIIAPSLIPTKPGDRRKCDKLDARKLAQYFEAGLLTSIHIPTVEQESVRDLVRCRFTIPKRRHPREASSREDARSEGPHLRGHRLDQQAPRLGSVTRVSPPL